MTTTNNRKSTKQPQYKQHKRYGRTAVDSNNVKYIASKLQDLAQIDVRTKIPLVFQILSDVCIYRGCWYSGRTLISELWKEDLRVFFKSLRT